jgi:hypothetical protein
MLEVGVEIHTTAALRREKNPGTHSTRGWAIPKPGLDVLEKNL